MTKGSYGLNRDLRLLHYSAGYRFICISSEDDIVMYWSLFYLKLLKKGEARHTQPLSTSWLQWRCQMIVLLSSFRPSQHNFWIQNQAIEESKSGLIAPFKQVLSLVCFCPPLETYHILLSSITVNYALSYYKNIKSQKKLQTRIWTCLRLYIYSK